MSLRLRWCYDNRILLLQGIGYLSVEDFTAIEDELTACLTDRPADAVHSPDQQPDTVHLLLDLNRVSALPSVQEWHQLNWLHSEGIGWILIIGLHQVKYQVLLTIVMQLTGQRNRFFQTRKKALAFLSLLDPDLPENCQESDTLDDLP